MKLIRCLKNLTAKFIKPKSDQLQQRLRNGEELLNQLNAQVFQLYQQGQFNQAVILAEQALELAQYVYQCDHPDIALSLNNLAALYQSQGKLSQAEPLYQEALAMWQRLFEGDHPDIATSLSNLAFLLIKSDRPTEDLELMQQAITMDDRLLRTNFAYSSERDRLTYIDQFRNNFDGFLSLISTYFSDSPEVVKIALSEKP